MFIFCTFYRIQTCINFHHQISQVYSLLATQQKLKWSILGNLWYCMICWYNSKSWLQMIKQAERRLLLYPTILRYSSFSYQSRKKQQVAVRFQQLYNCVFQTLDMLEKVCHQTGHEFLRLDGSTSVSRRMDLVDKFNSGYSSECMYMKLLLFLIINPQMQMHFL